MFSGVSCSSTRFMPIPSMRIGSTSPFTWDLDWIRISVGAFEAQRNYSASPMASPVGWRSSLRQGYSATLDKSPGDPSATPARIRESGFGDVEGQLRLRLRSETRHHPEIFSFLEMTPATQRHKVLIDEPNWDLKPGVGIIRGYHWGTLMVRVTAEWNREASSPDLGEVAVEYLRRLTPSLRLNVAVEGGEGGAPDEFDLITGVNWRLSDNVPSSSIML